MTKLSVVVITKNEENCLQRCLESCLWADEILVLDSGSSDKTLEIAHKCGARTLHQDWLGFGRQKQKAVTLAQNDWVLCVDADEYLTPELIRSIQAVMQSPKPGAQAYEIVRCNKFLGRYLRHGEGYPDVLVRLFNRQQAQWTDQVVHEHVHTSERPCRLSGDLMHDSVETIEKYMVKQNSYTSLQAGELFRTNKRAGLRHLVLSPLFRFFKFYVVKRGFLDGIPGFVHISIGCINTFCKYIKLIELQVTRKIPEDKP